MNKDLDFLNESNHNRFVVSDDESPFAEKNILSAIDFLKSYLKCDKVNVRKKKRTYEIKLRDKTFKVRSFKVSFVKDDAVCIVEVSNPFSVAGARYWTHFGSKDAFRTNIRTNKGAFYKGAFWTNKELLDQINPDIVFNLLSGNYGWIHERYVIVKKAIERGENILSADLPFVIEVSANLPATMEASPEQKEEIAFKVFEKIFKK